MRGDQPALRVVLAEDDILVREGARALLDLEQDVELVGAAAGLEDLLSLVDQHSPDVVLSDIRMPPTRTDEGIQAARRLRRSHPSTGVVVLSQYLEPAYASALFEDGAHGRAYLLKERVSEPEQLVEAIRAVARGGSVIDPRVVDVLITSGRVAPSPLDDLSAREVETLAEMAAGRNNSAIAQRLAMSDRAVEKHITSVFSKLGLSEERDVHRRVKAVLVYLSAREAPPAGTGPR